MIAPQRQQVMDLERDGFHGAQTVSAFLARSAMSHCVVLVDEAGQIGGRQMHQLLTFVRAQQGPFELLRLIPYSTARWQASDALRAIEKLFHAAGHRTDRNSAAGPGPGRRHAPNASRLPNTSRPCKRHRKGDSIASFNRLDRQGAIVVCWGSRNRR